MTPEQVQELGPAFSDYLQQFACGCDYPQTFATLEVYCCCSPTCPVRPASPSPWPLAPPCAPSRRSSRITSGPAAWPVTPSPRCSREGGWKRVQEFAPPAACAGAAGGGEGVYCTGVQRYQGKFRRF